VSAADVVTVGISAGRSEVHVRATVMPEGDWSRRRDFQPYALPRGSFSVDSKRQIAVALRAYAEYLDEMAAGG